MARFSVVVWGLSGLVACGGEQAGPPPVKVASDAAERVVFEPVAPVKSVTVGVLPASVVVPAEHKMALAAPLEGRVIAWRVGVGEAIAPGTPLMDLEVVGVADLEAELAEAQQLLTARSRTLQAERQAAAQGLASASGVLAYEVAVAEARARREALSAQIETRKRVVGGEGWTWTATVGGVVESIDCPRGQLARPDTPCLTVVDTARAVVRVEVPERWLARWGTHPIGGAMTLTGEATELELTEARRAPRLDERARTLTVDFTAQAPLVPGRSGRVALRSVPPQAAQAVSKAALTRLDGQDVVFVRSDEGAAPVVVERLGRDGELEVVRAADGAELREVATRGLFLLKSQHLLAQGDGE